MRFRLPPGCAGLSHAGETIGVAGDATIELGAAAASLLAPHGIVPFEERAPVDPAPRHAEPPQTKAGRGKPAQAKPPR